MGISRESEPAKMVEYPTRKWIHNMTAKEIRHAEIRLAPARYLLGFVEKT